MWHSTRKKKNLAKSIHLLCRKQAFFWQYFQEYFFLYEVENDGVSPADDTC